MKSEAGAKIGDTSTAMATKIGQSINRKYHEIFNLYNWVETVVIDESFTLTASAVQQILPGDIAIIYCISERSNDVLVSPTSPYIYTSKYIADVSSTNSPVAYTMSGTSALATKLSAAGTINVVSSSTADTTQTIRIWGKNSAGVYVTEQLTLNGTTQVTGSVSWAAGFIPFLTKSAVTAGNITVKTGTTTLDVIAPTDYCNKFLLINLQAPPDSAYTCYVSGKKPFKELYYAEDVPYFDVCDALVHYSCADVLRMRGSYQQAEVEIKEADRIVSALVTEKEVMDETADASYPTVAIDDIDKSVLGG